MQISKQLQDFIEVQFQEMCRNEEKLPKEREKDKRRREREHKRRTRELNRDLKALARLKDKVDIKGLEEKLMAKARRDNEEILGLESKCNPLYGKGRPDFNGFVMRCYYLIKKN